MPAKKASARARKSRPAAAAAAPAGTPDLASAFREQLRAVPLPSSNVVTLDADVAQHFPTSRAVNEALRALLRIVRQVRS